MSGEQRAFRARASWDGGRLLRDPLIVAHDGRIVATLEEGADAPSVREVVDFGDAILLPGFFNAHCHLEYSCLKGRLPAGMPFADWIGELARARHELPEEEFAAGAEAAVRESVQSGMTGILDIFTRESAEKPLRDSGMRAWAFLESIRLAPSECEASYADVFARLSALRTDALFHAGLSPHTPYTVSAPLMRKIARLARGRSIPLAIHVAETREERLMLEEGEGSLVELFRRMGVLPKGWAPPGFSPVDWADRNGALGAATLIVHANDLTPVDIAQIAARGSSVVYCPRTHRYFGRALHPLERLMDARVNVCIGTDSLASNDRLDLLAELRAAHEDFPDIRATELFAMIGRNVGRFLGMEGRLGTLLTGNECDITVLSPPPPLEGGPEAALTWILENEGAQAVGTVVGGNLLHKSAG